MHLAERSSPPPVPLVRDVIGWYDVARRYVTDKGWRGPNRDDLVQEMAVVFLEHPTQWITYAFAYLHAMDRWNPRRQIAGTRLRQSQTEIVYDATWHAQRPAPDDLDVGLALHAYLRHLPRPAWGWLIRWLCEGWSLHELAVATGITSGSMSGRVATIRAQLRRAGITGQP